MQTGLKALGWRRFPSGKPATKQQHHKAHFTAYQEPVKQSIPARMAGRPEGTGFILVLFGSA